MPEFADSPPATYDVLWAKNANPVAPDGVTPSVCIGSESNGILLFVQEVKQFSQSTTF